MINAAYIIIIKKILIGKVEVFIDFLAHLMCSYLIWIEKKYMNVKLWMKDTAKNIWTNLSTIFWQYQVS